MAFLLIGVGFVVVVKVRGRLWLRGGGIEKELVFGGMHFLGKKEVFD